MWSLSLIHSALWYVIKKEKKKFSQWSAAGAEATGATAAASALVVVPDIRAEKIWAQLTEGEETDIGGDQWRLLFPFLRPFCFLISLRNSEWCHSESNGSRLISWWVLRRPSCHYRGTRSDSERRVWCVLSLEGMGAGQPAGGPTLQPSWEAAW